MVFEAELLGNCTAEEALCSKSSFLTPPGVCDANTGLCVCEEAYSGNDDWQQFNTCSVNESLRDTVHVVVLLLNLGTLVYAMYGINKLLEHWDIGPLLLRRGWSSTSHKAKRGGAAALSQGVIPVESVRTSRTVNTSMVPNISGEFGHGKQSPSPYRSRLATTKARRLQFRQRATLATLACFVLYAFGESAALLFYLSGTRRYDVNAGQDFFYGVGAAAAYSGFYLFLFLFVMGLPSIKHFGDLFGVKSVLVRWPRAVRVSIYARLALLWFILPFLLFLYPNAVAADAEVRQNLDTAYLWLNVVMLLDFVVFSLVLCHTLNTLYTKLLPFSEERELDGVAAGAAEVAAFKRALTSIRYYVVAVCTLGPWGSIAFIVLLASARARSHSYLAVSFTISNAAFSCIFGTFILTGARFGFIGPKVNRNALNDVDLERHVQTNFS